MDCATAAAAAAAADDPLPLFAFVELALFELDLLPLLPPEEE